MGRTVKDSAIEEPYFCSRMPVRMAVRTASSFVDALSFCRKLRMWFRTVCLLMRNSAAIRGVSRPKATSCSTWASRRLKADGDRMTPGNGGLIGGEFRFTANQLRCDCSC